MYAQIYCMHSGFKVLSYYISYYNVYWNYRAIQTVYNYCFSIVNE